MALWIAFSSVAAFAQQFGDQDGDTSSVDCPEPKLVCDEFRPVPGPDVGHCVIFTTVMEFRSIFPDGCELVDVQQSASYITDVGFTDCPVDREISPQIEEGPCGTQTVSTYEWSAPGEWCCATCDVVGFAPNPAAIPGSPECLPVDVDPSTPELDPTLADLHICGPNFCDRSIVYNKPLPEIDTTATVIDLPSIVGAFTGKIGNWWDALAAELQAVFDGTAADLQRPVWWPGFPTFPTDEDPDSQP
ncbi:MAG: hypothetical protein AAGA48_16615 [Myxococcota bacterium]